MNAKTKTSGMASLAAVLTSGVTMALLVAPAPASAVRPAPYAALDLGFSGEAWAINQRGQIAGEGRLPGQDRVHPFLWTRGTVTDLGVLEQGEREYGRATDVNDHAQVVGFSVVRQDPEQSGQHAFLWQNGKLTDLDPTGDDSIANAINNHGQIAGTRYTADGPHAVVWQHGTMTDLGPGVATDINDKGQVIGSATATGATLWYRGRAYDLGAPPGAQDWRPVAISADGWIAGNALAGLDFRAYLWRAGSIVDLGTLGGPGAEAVDINDRGEVLGVSGSTGTNAPAHAFLWRHGTMTDLFPRGIPEYPTIAALGNHGEITGSVGASAEDAGGYLPAR